jgi:hypothetical protein
MAPTASEHGIPISTKTVAVAVVIIAAAVWLILSNMPPAPPKEQPKVIRINATATPPPQPPPTQQNIASMFMCRGEAYRTRNGITICGVEMVTDQYVFIRHGWIYAPNSTFTLIGDVSACRLSVSVNMLHLNCTAPIMVAR